MKKIIFLIIIFFNSNIFCQQNIGFTTDRPRYSVSAFVVPANSIQIETGFSYNHQKYTENNVVFISDNLSLLNTLVRFGITNLLELRVGGEYFSSQSKIDKVEYNIDGINALKAGLKYVIRREEKYFSDLALLAEVGMPFGNEKLRPSKYVPKFLIIGNQYLNAKADFGISLGVEYIDEFSEYFYDYGVICSYNIANRLTSYIELFGKTRKKYHPMNNIDVGLTYLHTQNLQIDFSFGKLLNKDKSDYFAAVGFSVRFLNQ